MTPTATVSQVSAPKPRGRRKKIRTEPVRPVCPQCDKQFSNQSALTKHKLTHSDERKFACQQCSKAFKRHDHLTGHMQTHSNRKPFNCTIQGCDKMYCDARSLRRHKENIHHIVTTNGLVPAQPVQFNNNTTSSTEQQQLHHHQQQQQLQQQPPTQPQAYQQQQQQPAPAPPPQAYQQQQQQQPQSQVYQQPPPPPPQVVALPSLKQEATADSTAQQQPSQLLRRRQHYQQQQQQHHHHHQAPFSADYLAPQHFSFDFDHTNHNMDQPPSSITVPHSADSITDSGLGLNVKYEQQMTAQVALPPSFNQQQSTSDPTAQPQPSHLLRRRQHYQQQQHHQAPFSADYRAPQHFSFDLDHMNHNMDQPPSSNTVPHSADSITDSGLGLNVQYEQQMTPQVAPPPNFNQQQQPTPDSTVQSQPSHLLRRRQHYQQQQHHQAPFSADYRAPQHFSFDLDHMNHYMDQPPSSNTVPHSADSITDSGLGLNVQYEQQMTTQVALPPSFNQQQQSTPDSTVQQQPSHLLRRRQYYPQQHHQAPFSADYATTREFSFEFDHMTHMDRPVEQQYHTAQCGQYH